MKSQSPNPAPVARSNLAQAADSKANKKEGSTTKVHGQTTDDRGREAAVHRPRHVAVAKPNK